MAIVGAAMQIAFWAIVIPTAIYLLSQTATTLFYTIGMLFFKVMDMLQSTFRKLAGLGGTVTVNDVTYQDGDILTALLNQSAIIDVLISVTVFAIGLVIIASIVQIIRLEYTTEGSKNSKEQIFAKAGKSLIMFILIPIVCFVGIRVSNYLLQAVDYATSASGASTVSGSVFTAAATDASKVLDKDNCIIYVDVTNLLGSLVLGWVPGYANPIVEDGKVKGFEDAGFVYSGSSDHSNRGVVRTALAKKVNQAFTMASTDSNGVISVGMKVTGDMASGTILTSGSKLSYLNMISVQYFYRLPGINYLILYLGCYFGIKTLFTACMGLIARLYKLAALFVISPAAIGLQPIDDGKAYKDWRGNFIKNVLSCYGIIVALNLYFTIVGVLQTVELFGILLLDQLVQFMMVLTGATMINDLASMIGNMIGANDVMADGQKASSAVGELASKVGSVAGGVAMGAGGAIAGKVKSFAAKRSTKTKNADGSVTHHRSMKDTDKYASMDDKDLSKISMKAGKKFDSKYTEDDKGNIFDKKGRMLTGDKYQKAKDLKRLSSEKGAKELKAEAQREQQTSKQYAGKQAQVAAGNVQAGLGMNRLVGMAGGMFGGLKNLTGIGGMQKMMEGKTTQEADQKYLEGLKKKGVNLDAMGIDPEKPQAAGSVQAFNKVQDAAQQKIVNSTVNKHQNAAEAANSGANQVETVQRSVDTAKTNAANARDGAQEVQKGIKESHSNIEADVDRGVVEELKQAIKEAGGTDGSALNETAERMLNDSSINEETKQVIRDAVRDTNLSDTENKDVVERLDSYGSADDRKAYDQAKTVESEAREEIKRLNGINVDKMVAESVEAGYNPDGTRKTQKDDKGNDKLDKNGMAIPVDFAETLGKTLAAEANKQGLNGTKGNDELTKAINGLKESLSKDGVKASLKDVDETKLKFDDANIIKILTDIKAEVAAREEKKDDDDLQKDILSELKKLNKKK